jgi:hypothetical protein
MSDTIPPLPQAPYAQPAPTPGKAIAALVCGILGITMCGCFPLGIVAWVLGKQAEREILASGGALQGEGIAKAGWITGIIGTIGGALYAGVIVVAVCFSICADTQGY